MHTITEEAVRSRAYEIWEMEGHPQGRESEHWRQAEEELSANPTGFDMGTTMDSVEDAEPFASDDLGELAPDGARASKRAQPN